MFLYFALSACQMIIRGYQLVHQLNSIYVEIVLKARRSKILITHQNVLFCHS